MIAVVVGLLLLPAAVGVWAIGVYLLVLSAAAIGGPRKVARQAARARRFAVLVPAHDEERVIARLLRSLAEQTYPRELVDVFVVADNCADSTAALARARGAIVYERHDDVLRAKGHALRWLLERVRDVATFDAYVILDADSVVSPDLIERMDDHLAAGSRVLQAHYRVLNPGASPLTALREAALASLHYLRPLGRARLGLSVGLKGNGMCFEARTLDLVGWSATGLAEDVELHLALVRAGVRTDFVPEATVRADMPTTIRAANSQNMRWEAGRISAARTSAIAMARDGVRARSAVLFDAAVEQLIPPLSVVVATGAFAALASWLAGAAAITAIATLGTVAVALHVLAGLAAVRAPRRTYVALLLSPAYVVWKVGLYARALLWRGVRPWIRTARSI